MEGRSVCVMPIVFLVGFMFWRWVVDETDNYVMLSALQHFVYCPRQFALIHLEQVWEENKQNAEAHSTSHNYLSHPQPTSKT